MSNFNAAEQERVRRNLRLFLTETKTKQKDVADAIYLPQDTLSRFKTNGKRKQYLYQNHLEALDRYLTSKGYGNLVMSPEDF